MIDLSNLFTIVTAARPTRETALSTDKYDNFELINEVPRIIRALSSYAINLDKTTVCLRKAEYDDENCKKTIANLSRKIVLTPVPNSGVKGALITSLFGLENVQANQPILVCAGDSEIKGGISKYIEDFQFNNVSAGTICFESDFERYSYVATEGKSSKIIEVAEKRIISNYATTGVFYFQNAELFRKAAAWVIVNNQTTNGNYFVSSTLNFLISQGFKVEMKKIPNALYCDYSNI